MPIYAGFSNRFNSGELSPEAWSASDLQQHAYGCALGLNCVSSVAGPMVRRGGFRFASRNVPDATPSRLVRFVRGPEDALHIEVTAGACLVWNADGSPFVSGGGQVSFGNDLTLDEMRTLRWEQTNDVIVFTTSIGTKPRRLKRLSETGWDWGPYDFREGPWRAENDDRGWAIEVHGDRAVGALVELRSSLPLFEPGHVGSRWRFRVNAGASGMPTWAPGTQYTPNSPALSNGRTYVYNGIGGGTTNKAGTTPPSHDYGTVSDGVLEWEYHDDGAGVVRVTEVLNATTAKGVLEVALPYYMGLGTTYWSEGRYSDYRGWPRAKPAIREERWFFGGGPSDQDRVDATRTAGFTADFADFKPGLGTGRVVADDAVSARAGDTPGRIQWFMSGSYLIAGTTAAEVIITGATLDDPVQPDGYSARDMSKYGSDEPMPIIAHDVVLFVQRGGRTLREAGVSPDQTTSKRDLSVLAQHIAKRRIVQLAWSASENICWARLRDGGLAAFAYHIEQNVYGWTRQAIGGGWTVEDISVLPGYEGRDLLWCVVSRTKNGSLQRGLMVQTTPEDAIFYDACEIYEGAPVNAVSGLDHLDGEKVSVLVDGAEYRDRLVSGGVVDLPPGVAGSRIAAGLPILARFQSLPLDLGGPGGSMGRRTSIKQGVVILDGVEAYVKQTDAAGRGDRVSLRKPSEVSAPEAKRFSQVVTFEGDTEREVSITVETDCGYPLSIYALRPKASVND